MPLNSVFSWFMKKRVHQINLFEQFPHEVQQEVFENLMAHGRLTDFGREHGLANVRSVEDYKKAVPVRSYEGFYPYIEKLRDGAQGVLWPSKLKWFAKSSGTTADRSKFIPVTKEALEDCHYKGGKDLLALYYTQNPNAAVYKGKHLVMGGSTSLSEYSKDSYSGDLSAIIIKNLPMWVELKRVPNKDIALMEDWEGKIERTARSTIAEDVTSISGVPSWTMVLFKRILEITGKQNMHEVWPNMELYMHGGVSFKPYVDQYRKMLPGSNMHFFQTYNASEGSFGIQDRLGADDMLLMLDYGIYFEFMPMSEYGKDNPETLDLKSVQLNTNYALVISTTAGLWRYLIGDTVRFTSKSPYRIQVSGRTKLFINAFGEELIIDNAEHALRETCNRTGAIVVEYTAAPVYMIDKKSGGHEWLIEFEKEPASISEFTAILDSFLCSVNSDYEAKRTKNLSMQAPLVRSMPKGVFHRWLKSKGKLGGQHKVPRLCNDRKYIEEINQILQENLV